MFRADDLTFAFVAFASFPVVDEMIGDPRHDVIIVGGDPAGAATALSLRSHAPDLSVALIEQTNYHAMRIGETLPPLVQPLLERIGVWQAFWLKITCRLMARARHGVPMRCTRTSSSFNLRSADGIWIDDPLMKWSRVKRRVEALFCTPTQARREKRWATSVFGNVATNGSRLSRTSCLNRPFNSLKNWETTRARQPARDRNWLLRITMPIVFSLFRGVFGDRASRQVSNQMKRHVGAVSKLAAEHTPL
jgi:hypothetical protein